MKYNFKVPEIPSGESNKRNILEGVKHALNYWNRVKDGKGYEWEKKLYTAQTLEPEFIEANLIYFTDWKNKLTPEG